MSSYSQVPTSHFLTLKGKGFYKRWPFRGHLGMLPTTVSKRSQIKLNSSLIKVESPFVP